MMGISFCVPDAEGMFCGTTAARVDGTASLFHFERLRGQPFIEHNLVRLGDKAPAIGALVVNKNANDYLMLIGPDRRVSPGRTA
jgi:hypothetical protein